MITVVEDFVSGILACDFLFVYLCTENQVSLRDFGIRVMLALYSEFQSVPSCFWRSLRRTGISYFFSVWKNSPVRLSVLHFGLLGGF